MKLHILLFILVLSSTIGLGQRKTNFPKTVEYVDEMPSPNNFWIFVMAGQSNMAGRGLVEPQDTIPNKRILTIDKSGRWIYAKEPLHFYEPKNTGLDCGLTFAKTLSDSIPKEISIGIIPCAVGGSSIEQWLGDETFRGVQLLSNLKSKVDLAQKDGTIKGILWHQGESNAKLELIPNYADNLNELTKTFRGIIKNYTLPIWVGQLGSYAVSVEKQNHWNAINSIIHDVGKTDENIHVISAEGLEHKGDTLHFNSESQREMGRRFAFKYLEK